MPPKKKITIKKRGPGRPPLETPRVKVPVRVDITDKARWDAAAKVKGLSLAAWIRSTCCSAVSAQE